MQYLDATLERLAEVGRLLDEATDNLGVMETVAVRGKVEYLKSYYTTFLRVDGPMDLRKAQAELTCIDAYEHKELCEANLRTGKERLRTLRDQMEILRTTSAAQRLQAQTEATGQWT